MSTSGETEAPERVSAPKQGYVLVDKEAMQAQYQMDTKLFAVAGMGVGMGVVLGVALIGGALYYQGVVKIANLKQ